MSFNYFHTFIQLLLYYYIIALLSKGGGRRRRSNRLVTSESSIACKKEGNIKGSENETKTQNNGNVSSIFHIVMPVDHGDFQDKIGIIGSMESRRTSLAVRFCQDTKRMKMAVSQQIIYSSKDYSCQDFATQSAMPKQKSG